MSRSHEEILQQERMRVREEEKAKLMRERAALEEKIRKEWGRGSVQHRL